MNLKDINKESIIEVVNKFINKSLLNDENRKFVVNNCWYNSEIECWIVDCTEKYSNSFSNTLDNTQTLIDEDYFEIILGKKGVWQTQFDEKLSKNLKTEWVSFLQNYENQSKNSMEL